MGGSLVDGAFRIVSCLSFGRSDSIGSSGIKTKHRLEGLDLELSLSSGVKEKGCIGRIPACFFAFFKISGRLSVFGSTNKVKFLPLDGTEIRTSSGCSSLIEYTWPGTGGRSGVTGRPSVSCTNCSLRGFLFSFFAIGSRTVGTSHCFVGSNGNEIVRFPFLSFGSFT